MKGSAASWTPWTLCMQGMYRAPMLMRTNGEGPIMGLKEGWISMGEPVSWAVLN